MAMSRGSTSIISDGLKAVWDKHYAGECDPATCFPCEAIRILEVTRREPCPTCGHKATYEEIFNAKRL